MASHGRITIDPRFSLSRGHTRNLREQSCSAGVVCDLRNVAYDGTSLGSPRATMRLEGQRCARRAHGCLRGFAPPSCLEGV